MGPSARREFVADLRSRYARAGRHERGVLLDQAVEATGYHRKSLIAILRKATSARRSRPRPGPRCGARVAAALVALWRAAGYPWSRRLHAMVRLWLEALVRRHTLDRSEQDALLAMSPRTMDRILRPHRGALRRRLYGRTKPGLLLKHQIPIRSERWNVSEPGWCEIDTVVHCGTSSGGDFACSVNLTDIMTGWTETRAVQGKGQLAVLAAIDEMRTALPFPLLGLDSDSGSEFINSHCAQWCTRHGVAFTRSRPYRKNDNAHIEQKNFTHVRKILGWQRLGGDATVGAMNELYRSDLRLFMNLFQPSVKLIERIRIGSRVRRSYDAAATPLDRLHGVREDLAAQLVTMRDALDPIALGEGIDTRVAAILAHETPATPKAVYRGPNLRALSRRQVRAARLAEGLPVRSHVAR